MIDTHAHLDYEYDLSTQGLIDEAHMAGVHWIVTIAAEPPSISRTKKLAECHPNVFFTSGIHPHEAGDYSDELEDSIQMNASHPKCIAIGEIGLDYHYDHSPRDIQREVFKRQLLIAKETKNPLVIHTREAEEDSLNLLSEHVKICPFGKEGNPPHPGVIHSFTGSAPFAKECLSMGFFIAFNGIITFKKSQDLRDIVMETPLDRILLETDCPYLTPVPHRGKKNRPAYLRFIADKIAECHGVTAEEVCRITTENAGKVFPKLGLALVRPEK